MTLKSAINPGYFLAIKTSGRAGGGASITYITGSELSGRRGLEPRGSRGGHAPLEIWRPDQAASILSADAGDPPAPSAYSAFSTQFDSRGIAVIPFLYDYSVIPQTVAGKHGLHATPFTYAITGVTGASGQFNGHLLHFSNIFDSGRTFQNVVLPSFPIPGRLQSALSAATSAAQRIAAATNSLSRHVMAGVTFVEG
ncbi:hypothetical protein ACRARG_16825 [Pseudooceanicola sp. C21-150M6]|uniref:hypothetical protein n=1 Tax=Pseudooceanicola sp. C21-150M6 TaxID=3434355 RepID=UPI003D7F8761